MMEKKGKIFFLNYHKIKLCLWMIRKNIMKSVSAKTVQCQTNLWLSKLISMTCSRLGRSKS
jgi:hypothetical protein